MRLLNTSTRELEFFPGGEIPPYAILSHTWEENEVTFQQHQKAGINRDWAGWIKIQKSIELAVSQGLGYIWIDTCCIDKTSSAELSEAINTMFLWYERAEVCYVYLSDVTSGQDPVDFTSSTGHGPSRWFSRGWTLQELIAPRRAEFYDSDWTNIGTREELSGAIRSITRISLDLLCFKPTASVPSVSRLLELTSVGEKLSWAAKRVTTREEDIAYSLLGLFDINIPLLYGEGRKKAFGRLQEEILRSTDDESVFAWRLEKEPIESPFCGLLAEGPECFGLFSDHVPRRPQHLSGRTKRGVVAVSRSGVQIELPLAPFPSDASGTIFLALLSCSMFRNGLDTRLTPSIILQRMSHEDETKFVRVRADLLPLCMMNRVVDPGWLMNMILNKQVSNGGSSPFVKDTIFEEPRPVSIFIPGTILPSRTPSGFIFRPQIGGNSTLEPLQVVDHSPTWQIRPDSYEINFIINPVPAVEDIRAPVTCGMLKLWVNPADSKPGAARHVRLVVGLEPLRENVFGTPGLYVVPWHDFVTGAAVQAGSYRTVVSRETRRLTIGEMGRMKVEFGFEMRYSWLFYTVQLEAFRS